jgi:head-tail adaptor
MTAHYSEMKQRITLYTQEKIQDEYGGYKINWNELISVWAKQSFVKNCYETKKHGIKNELFNIFTIRNIDDLHLPLMLTCGAKNYIAKKIEPHSENEDFLSIFCKLERGV